MEKNDPSSGPCLKKCPVKLVIRHNAAVLYGSHRTEYKSWFMWLHFPQRQNVQ